MNANQKSGGFFGNFFKVVGFIYVLWCISSILSIRKSTSNVPSSPIIKDMSVETITTTPSRESKTSVSKTEPEGENISKKPAKLSIYNNCDCASDEVHVLSLNPGIDLSASGEVSINEEDQWKCIKSENMRISDFDLAYSGKYKGKSTNHDGPLEKINNFDTEYKVGCLPDVTEFKTERLKFKWNVRE